MAEISWKDLVEEIDPEPPTYVAYDFNGPDGEGKFVLPSNEEGHGVYE